ncbi:hypothetical protein IQ07DRAFT_634187 [Pyrenochaeta sp. DS3sAY3a]|nr:hypothetical protein IQ07DRAFT_634187 [Pyrenochaeta sp. DS3sAY3a]
MAMPFPVPSTAILCIIFVVHLRDNGSVSSSSGIRGLEKVRTAVKNLVDTLVWIDQLCINQSDNDERSHQVSLMGSIYSAARQVIIWVSERVFNDSWFSEQYPEDDEDVRAQRAFGAICDVVNRWKRNSREQQRESYSLISSEHGGRITSTTFEDFPKSAKASKDSSLISDASAYQFGPKGFERIPVPDHGIDSSPDQALTSPFWLSIEDLFARSWFWRVWTIQEACLAQRAVVKWANTEIDWQWVGIAAAILRTSYNRICDAVHIAGVYNAYLLFRLSRLSHLPSPRLSFIQLLRLTRQFDVTDPRDPIYGLLGLNAEGNDPLHRNLFLEPDYSITEVELWKRVACKAITATNNLSVLSSVQYTTLEYDLVPESNWVPHWQKVFRATFSAWDLDECFSASKGLQMNLEFTDTTIPDILRLEGVQVGVVGFTGFYMWHDVDTSFLLTRFLGPFLVCEAGLALMARTFTAGRSEYGSLLESTDHQALVVGGGFAYKPRESKNFRPLFERREGLKEQLESLAIRGDAERFRATAVAICERRRLFMALNGYLGLGPDNVREGDVAVVLAGGDVPYLLRPIQSKATSNESNEPIVEDYVLVGECYIEGLMEGQAVRAMENQHTLQGLVPVEQILAEILEYANDPRAEFGFAYVKGAEPPQVLNSSVDNGKTTLDRPKYTRASLQTQTIVDAKLKTFSIR